MTFYRDDRTLGSSDAGFFDRLVPTACAARCKAGDSGGKSVARASYTKVAMLALDLSKLSFDWIS